MQARHESLEKAKKPSFDVAALLTALFRSIAKHGIIESLQFSESWMCPLYKKGDRADIANYRPISLLNTDHKILTKVLSVRLSKVAPELIHRDQAGFMKGRLIYDQVHQTDLIVSAANVFGINGAVIALDQEKAYDKISHAYLWKVMKKVGLPESFTQTVKNLYAPAKTQVVINGFQSNPYAVRRGVRQGCPLSCLLFNLAIEPLAEMIRSSPNLKGFCVKDQHENIQFKLSLYADDTTVYLSEEDDYKALDDILKVWCRGSKAKFNINKTEVLPFGTEKYRAEVARDRRLNRQSVPFPEGAKIAKDKETIRILGAWLGNDAELATQWTTIVEKISEKLEVWEKTNPSLEGRRFIHQLVFGSRTQYKSAILGTPKDIETLLIRMQRNSTKGSGRHEVSLDTLQLNFEQGGKNLLDIPARDEAIQIMRLKSYLAKDDKRPNWARLADILIRNDIPKALRRKDPETLLSFTLQKWESRKTKSNLPKILSDMLKTARKYEIRPTAAKEELTKKVVNEMPIWNHYYLRDDASNRRESIKLSQCLRTAHKVKYVGQTLKLAQRMNTCSDHKAAKNCNCAPCKKDREAGCQYPHACTKHATKLLDHLQSAWDPRNHPDRRNDTEAPGEHRQENVVDVVKKRPQPITERSELYKIFTNVQCSNGTGSQPNEHHHEPGNGPRIRIPARNERIMRAISSTYDHRQTINVHTAGWCSAKHGNSPAGIGTWYGKDDSRNLSIRVDHVNMNPLRAELLGVIQTLAHNPKECNINIWTSSSNLRKAILTKTPDWEKTGWIGVDHSDAYMKMLSLLRNRKGDVSFKLAEKYDENTSHAKELAKKAASLSPAHSSLIALDLPLNEQAQIGCRIACMTQALAYRAIKAKKYETIRKKRERAGTTERLNTTKEALNEVLGYEPRDSAIFQGIRSKELSRNVKEFLFNDVHKTQKVGAWWYHIPNYEHRATCEPCGETDSLEHILTDCPHSGQQIIWKLAYKLLNKKIKHLPDMCIGTILGCPLFPFKSIGERRLFSIVISESAFMIWKCRNERVVGGKEAPTKRAITAAWIQMINSRLQQDCAATSQRRFKKRALDKELVMDTWRGTLRDAELNNDSNNSWTHKSGVLVGMSLADAG